MTLHIYFSSMPSGLHNQLSSDLHCVEKEVLGQSKFGVDTYSYGTDISGQRGMFLR
jgi:hypothetical protein